MKNEDQDWQDEATRYRRFMKQCETYILWRASAHKIDVKTAVRMIGEWGSTAEKFPPPKTGPILYGPVKKPEAGW